MTDDEEAPDPTEPEEPESADEIRRAIDELPGSLSRTRPRPPRAQAEQIPEDARERIEAELGDVAYIQHAYATDDHHVCRVGLRKEGEIREDIAVVGPSKVVRQSQIEARTDMLRRGADPSEVAGLLTDGE